MRTLITVCLTVASLVTFSITTAVGSSSHDCHRVTVSLGANGEFEGQARHIVATNVSCRRARRVAAACVRGSHRGWRFEKSPGAVAGPRRSWGDQFILTRAAAHVSFYIVGGGGCDPHQA